MSSSPAISLFSAQPELNQQPYSFLVSVLAHALAVGLLLLGFMSVPKVKTPAIAERYEVRHLDLHSLDSEMEQAVASARPPRPAAPQAAPAPSAAPRQAALRQMLQAPPGPQTLVAAGYPQARALAVEIPVPTVVIWQRGRYSLQEHRRARRRKAARLRREAFHPEAQSGAESGGDRHSRRRSAGAEPDHPSHHHLAGHASGAQADAAGAHHHCRQHRASPPPPRFVSLSNTRMANGAVTLPPVNESASTNSPGALAPGQPKDSSAGGAWRLDRQRTRARRRNRIGKEWQTGRHAGDQEPTGMSGIQSRLRRRRVPAPASQSSDKRYQAAQGGPVRIRRGWLVAGGKISRDGGPVERQMSYTVYLHMGLPKSWILTYSLPARRRPGRSAPASHLEAPWPYDMVLPNIAPDSFDADALMIHGFVNLAGRFESAGHRLPAGVRAGQFVLELALPVAIQAGDAEWAGYQGGSPAHHSRRAGVGLQL